ncbi:hypothetical protein [Fulvimarina sp. MAC3]
MANAQKTSVALTPDMAAVMRGVVSKREYASARGVMREAFLARSA